MEVFQVNLGWLVPSVFFPHLFQDRTSGDKWHRFPRARCSSWHQANGVRALKETQSTDNNHKKSPSLVSYFFSSATRFLREITDWVGFKGTLRRRLSHGYFSFIAKYTSSWLMSHRSHPQIITFKGAEPNFLAWCGEIWSMLWNLIQLLIATHHFMNHVSSFPLRQVWIYETKNSQICSY